MAAIFDEFEMPIADTLIKVAMFVLVQALVYLILTTSSSIFSCSDNGDGGDGNNKMARSSSFEMNTSSSARRIFAVFSDLSTGPSGEPLESPKVRLATIEEEHSVDAEKHQRL